MTLLASLFAVCLSSAAVAQERHVAKGKYVPIFRAGQKAERKADDLREEGEAEEANAQYRRAIRRYNQVITMKQNYLPAYLRLSRVHGILKRNLQAAALLKRALKMYPDNLDIKEQLAIHLTLGGYTREGIPMLATVGEQRPDKLQVQVLLANYYREKRDAAKQIVVLGRILKVRPRAYNRRVELGNALLRLGRTDEALASFRKVPEGTDFSNEAHLGVGRVLLRQHEPKRALEVLTGVEKQLSTGSRLAPETSLAVALALRHLERYDDALRRYRQYVKRWPRDARGYLGAGVCLVEAGRYADAIEQLQYALRLYPRSPRIYQQLARAFLGAGKAEAAQKNQRQAVKLAPKDWQRKSYLGHILRRAGKVREALKLHAKLASSRRWSAVLQAELGHDHFYAGRLDRALASYERALKRHGPKQSARRGVVLVKLRKAHRLLADGKLDAARSAFEKILRLKAYLPHIHAALAAIELQKRKPAKALAWLKKTDERDPSWVHRLLEGRALVELGKSQQALPVLAAIELSQVPPAQRSGVMMALGKAELLQGKYDGAVSKLDGLKGPKARALLAAAFVGRAEARWEGGQAKLALSDAAAATRLKRYLSSVEQMRALLISSLAAAELGRSKRSLAALAAVDRHRRFKLSTLMRSKKWAALVRGYIYYRNGDYKRARRALGALAGDRRKAGKVARELLVAALRSEAASRYQHGQYRAAALAIQQLRRAVKKLNVADQLLMASIDYQRGKRKAALQVFQRLRKKLPEAELDLGIYYDEVGKDKHAAFRHYVAYLRRAGGRASPRVRRWIQAKERIFGFKR